MGCICDDLQSGSEIYSAETPWLHESHQKTVAPRYSDLQPLCGLFNGGNGNCSPQLICIPLDCFINAALQALFASEQFRYSIKGSRDSPDDPCSILSGCLFELERKQFKYDWGGALRTMFGYQSYSQGDASEFCLKVISAVHCDAFFGIQKSHYSHANSNCSGMITKDEFQCIALSCGNIQVNFSQYYSHTRVDAFICSNCNDYLSWVKVEMMKQPEILRIQLNLFDDAGCKYQETDSIKLEAYLHYDDGSRNRSYFALYAIILHGVILLANPAFLIVLGK